MVLNIVLDDIDLNDILSQVIILYICNLCVLVTFLCQIIEVISLHLLDDLNQSVVESTSQFQLLLVGARKVGETFHVRGVLSDSGVAQPQDLHDLLVNGLVLILGVVGQLVALASPHSGGLQSNNLTTPGRQLSRTSPTVILLAVILFSSHELSPFGWMIDAGTSAGWVVGGQAMSMDISRTDKRLPLQILTGPIVNLLWALWVIGLRTLGRLTGVRLGPSVEHDLNIIPNRYDKFPQVFRDHSGCGRGNASSGLTIWHPVSIRNAWLPTDSAVRSTIAALSKRKERGSSKELTQGYDIHRRTAGRLTSLEAFLQQLAQVEEGKRCECRQGQSARQEGTGLAALESSTAAPKGGGKQAAPGRALGG